MKVLALESSTSAAKALLFDTERGVERILTRPYGPEISKNGQSDTAQVTALTLALGAEAANGQPVEAVALCGIWHNVAFCDRQLQPLGKTYSWDYLAAGESCAAMQKNKALTSRLYEKTGCMVHSSYPRQMLLHWKEQGERLTDCQLISQAGYTFYCLTGVYCESLSTASGSGLVNIHSLQYDRELLEMTGLQESQLPPLTTYLEPRPLSRKGAALLGLQAGIPVVPPYPDGALNQIASCAGQPGKMTLSIGTSGAIRLTAGKPILPEGHQLWCYYGVTDWITGAAISGAGNCINWVLQDLLQGKWTYEDFEGLPEPPAPQPVFLPFLFGERCPGWSSCRRSGFFDLRPEHRAADLYRAVQAGILMNLYQCFEVLQAQTGKPEEILVSGGILHSPRWTQMLADLFGQELSCVPNVHASTMGAVILAMHAAGALENVWSYRGEYDQAQLVRPREDFRLYYRTWYERYLHWYARSEL